jgi:uncharacterized protein (TIGR02246 family)
MQNDEQAIRQLVTNWGKATETGDVEQVLGLIADDAIFLIAGHPPMNKSEFAAGQAAIKDIGMQISSDIQEIKLMGEWAYCWNKLSVKISPPDGSPSIIRAGNSLSILHKQAGNWRVVRDANMLSIVSP